MSVCPGGGGLPFCIATSTHYAMGQGERGTSCGFVPSFQVLSRGGDTHGHIQEYPPRTGYWGIPQTGPGVSPSHRQYTSSRSIHQGCVHRKLKGINIVALQSDEVIHFLPKWHHPALPSCFMKHMTLQPHKMAQSLFNTIFQTVCLKLLQLSLARCLLKHRTTPSPISI